METGQVKSRKRVSEHGEVFTSSREVKAMLDLVKQETERIDSRFLEPACGHGNFLAEILKRKLEVVDRDYSRSQYDFERNGIITVSSIYGIDLLKDNVEHARERLLLLFQHYYTKRFKANVRQECLDSVRLILNKNIIWGNALTLELEGFERPEIEMGGRVTLESLRNEKPKIVFSEWTPINGSLINRKDFVFAELVDRPPSDGLFRDTDGADVFIPEPVREFAPVHFLKLSSAYDD